MIDLAITFLLLVERLLSFVNNNSTTWIVTMLKKKVDTEVALRRESHDELEYCGTLFDSLLRRFTNFVAHET